MLNEDRFQVNSFRSFPIKLRYFFHQIFFLLINYWFNWLCRRSFKFLNEWFFACLTILGRSMKLEARIFIFLVSFELNTIRKIFRVCVLILLNGLFFLVDVQKFFSAIFGRFFGRFCRHALIFLSILGVFLDTLISVSQLRAIFSIDRQNEFFLWNTLFWFKISNLGCFVCRISSVFLILLLFLLLLNLFPYSTSFHLLFKFWLL